MKKAYVYMDGIGNVCFRIGTFHVEYIASAILTKILGVKEYDDTGYVVLDTNYGEEFYDFQEALEDLGLADRFDLHQIMSGIDQWVIGKR